MAELFLELVSLCEEVVTEVIADAMSTSVPIAERVQAYQRFALLWRLTGLLKFGIVVDHFQESLAAVPDNFHKFCLLC